MGYKTCLDCGEANARVEIARKAKCTAPAFNKGAYQYVGSIEAARECWSMNKGTLVRYDHKLSPVVGVVRYVCDNTGLTKVRTTCGHCIWAVTSQLRVLE